ncbi:hypothetical protein CDD83_2205 [Cordyceps sp. RAO-2017]|nr:hypothetical protein CDD83_2205 [Cordyceps sp. RAO-2017]
MLLDAPGVDAEARDAAGRTPLWFAVRAGHEAVVRLLLATGRVNPNEADDQGQTPLMMAHKQGNAAILRLVLARARLAQILGLPRTR